MEPKLTITVRRVAKGAVALEMHGELIRLAKEPLFDDVAQAAAAQ